MQMEKIMKKILLSILCLMSASAFAYNSPSRIEDSQHNQQERIDRGVRNGSLNPRETYQLERGQARIERMKEKAKADGVVTRAEREAIREEQHRQSRKIYDKKHNYR